MTLYCHLTSVLTTVAKVSVILSSTFIGADRTGLNWRSQARFVRLRFLCQFSSSLVSETTHNLMVLTERNCIRGVVFLLQIRLLFETTFENNCLVIVLHHISVWTGSILYKRTRENGMV